MISLTKVTITITSVILGFTRNLELEPNKNKGKDFPIQETSLKKPKGAFPFEKLCNKQNKSDSFFIDNA